MSLISGLVAGAIAAIPATGGGVAGVVTDTDTGLPLPGAVVALDDLGLATVTDEDGWYWLVDVPPGPQHLSVELLGYRSRSIHVLVPAGRSLRVDLALETEPIEVETVVVRGRIPLPGVDPERSDLDTTRRLSAAAIRNDPFAAEPDVLDALVGGPVARSPESTAGLHVRGGTTDQVGYLLDGLPVFSPYHAGLRSGAWSPAAVATVELQESPTLPTDALSGTIAATTVEPGDRLRSNGGITTSQLQFGLHGPLAGGTGFLLSARYGFPGFAFHGRETSYLRGRDHDLIAKLQTEAGGGSLRFLAFDNGNVLRFAPVSTDIDEGPVEQPGWNEFAWRSETWGIGWESDPGESPRWSARAWRSALEASAHWMGIDPSLRDIESERIQLGWSGSAEWGDRDRSTRLGVGIERDEVDYQVGAGEDGAAAFRRGDVAPSLRAYASVQRRPLESLEVGAELTTILDGAGLHTLPYVDLRWVPSDRLSVYARYVRTRQLAQSLRNGESIIGGLFPTELPVTDGSRIARAHTGVAGVLGVPWDGARLSAQVYARSVENLALVAPREGRPFATVHPAYGSASIRGGALELTTSAARYGIVASYGMERVAFRTVDVKYTPGYATRQRVRLGGIVHPTATFSVRLAWIGEFGRHGTDTIGVVEWESCNLLDGGCEVAGTPEALGALGTARLAAYHRLDLSIRKHWHVRIRDREARVEAFASGSNLLGRTNLLTYVVDPTTGERTPIEMRPAAPMAVGLAWSF